MRQHSPNRSQLWCRSRSPTRNPRQSSTLASKDAVLSSHLFFRGKFSVTTIVGESCDSGFSPALDAMAKDGKSAPFSNDSQASLDPWSYSTLRLIPGDTFSKNDSSVVVMEGAFVAGPSL